MDWSVILPIAAAAVAVVLSGAVAAIIANRASQSLAKKNAQDLATAAKKDDVENLRDSYAAQQAGYVALNATYAAENVRLNVEVGKLHDENLRLVTTTAADKAQCQSLIAALQQQVTVLTSKLPNPGDVLPVRVTEAAVPLPVKIVADEPVPVEVKAPIPVPMTTAQAQAVVDAAKQAEKGK